MSADHAHCAAVTRSAAPCKNAAQADSPYCYAHRHYATLPATEAHHQAELDALIAELNDLAAQLRRIAPDYAPPPYTPQGMARLLRTNVTRFTPDAVRTLRESMDGASLDDFKDIETWKGMWFTLNYLVQLEAKERSAGLLRRLSALPGVGTLADLKEMLKDTPPEEFLKLDTWKGVWFVVNYELQNQAGSLKQRLRGANET